MKKILAVASIGGHWVQLLRITRPLEERYEVVYMSTHPKCKSMVGTCRFHTMMDFSRWNAWKMLPASFNILGILLKERPAAIVTTGAAPGLLTIILGRMTGTKTIWIDSVANVQTMSACGKLARKFATTCTPSGRVSLLHRCIMPETFLASKGENAHCSPVL